MRFAIIDDLDEERARALKLFEEYRDVRHVSFLIDNFSSGEDFLSSEDHMGDAFSVHAFDYLLKPLNQDRLFTCLDDSMKLLPKPEEYLSFTSNGLEMRLFYGNIVVLQVSGHSTVLIDSTGKEYSVYSAFSVFTKPLMEDSRFLLVSRGVLINMDFMSAITALVLTIVIPAGALIASVIHISVNAVLLPLILLLFICYEHVLKSHLSVNASVFLLVMALMSFPSIIALSIDCQLHPWENIYSPCVLVNMIQVAISFLFLLIFGPVFSKFLSQLVDLIDSPKIWAVALPVPMIFILLNLLMQPREYSTMHVNRVYAMYLCYIVLAFFLFAVIYSIFYLMATEILRSAEDKQRIRFFEMQESQYLAQQRYIAESSRQRHDFRQHLSSIAQMVQNRAFDELTGYLSEYLNTLPDSQTIYCQNVPANALLNYYASMMDQAQIRRNWKISLPENLQISDPELCSLLGNLLENVLHGCQTLPTENRYHNFTICLEHDRFLYLVSSNNFNGVVKQKNHQYLSTHKNGSGIGLSSIATIAEKYNGIAQFSNTDEEFLINVVMDK